LRWFDDAASADGLIKGAGGSEKKAMEPVSTLIVKYYSLIWCVLLGLLGRYGGWWGKRKE
jgi:hypothetical protein